MCGRPAARALHRGRSGGGGGTHRAMPRGLLTGAARAGRARPAECARCVSSGFPRNASVVVRSPRRRACVSPPTTRRLRCRPSRSGAGDRTGRGAVPRDAAYRIRWASPQRHSNALRPHGHGLAHATSRKSAGKLERSRRAADADDAFFEWLAQPFEDADRELGQLVEEERSSMRERDLAGPHAGAATADERDARRAVVRRAERRARLQRRNRASSRRRVDARHLERGVAFERRHDRRQAAGEHGLADAGRPDEQQVVTAGRRGGKREARVRETAHVGEVERLVGIR